MELKGFRFPTADAMAEQAAKCCPRLRTVETCEGCTIRKYNNCPLALYYSFLTAAKLAGWNLGELEVRDSKDVWSKDHLSGR